MPATTDDRRPRNRPRRERSDAASKKIRVRCGECREKATVPADLAGRKVRCRSCRAAFRVPAAVVAAVTRPERASKRGRPDERRGRDDESHASGKRSRRPKRTFKVPDPAPSDLEDTVALKGADHPAHKAALKASAEGLAAEAPVDSPNGPFSVERRILDSGAIGGSAAMIGAVVWFVVGLQAGTIYLYPPILFVMGGAAFMKAMTKGPRRTDAVADDIVYEPAVDVAD